MVFPDEDVKLRAGNISNAEREIILIKLGEIAQEKYDEFIVQGGKAKGYDLYSFRGYLKFKPNLDEFDNDYWLEGPTEDRTKVAEFFEFGTGLYNTLRAGKYRAGYIRPTTKQYMHFKSKKTGDWVTIDKVKGVHPIFAMTKAIKYIEFNRKALQRAIRIEIQQNG